MTSVPKPKLARISRSLLPSLLSRMDPDTTGFALSISEASLVRWALKRARPVSLDEFER